MPQFTQDLDRYAQDFDALYEKSKARLVEEEELEIFWWPPGHTHYEAGREETPEDIVQEMALLTKNTQVINKLLAEGLAVSSGWKPAPTIGKNGTPVPPAKCAFHILLKAA